MRTPLVAGNWKMNGTLESSQQLLQELTAGVSSGNAEMAVCPPFPYLNQVAGLLQGSNIRLGAQNLCEQTDAGAFTGEVAGFMLKQLGCHYVIVGHSERRSIYGESNERVAEKFMAAQSAGLIPVFCVGESLEQRESNITEEIVAQQLDAVINKTGGVAVFNEAVIAYEPVWAIGTGKTATPEQAQQVHQFIRQRLAAHDATVAQQCRILYGGSVKGANAESLFAMEDIDGGLIGGASLNAQEFLSIYSAAV